LNDWEEEDLLDGDTRLGEKDLELVEDLILEEDVLGEAIRVGDDLTLDLEGVE
jgi:hypothetical protein